MSGTSEVSEREVGRAGLTTIFIASPPWLAGYNFSTSTFTHAMEATCVVNDRPVVDDGSHHNGNHAKHTDQIACLIRAPQAKSCIPCRLRKVKCSGGQPCQTCIKRVHPQLCSYSPETSKQLRRSRARSERQNGSHRRSDLHARALDLSPVSQSHPQRASSDHRGDSYSTCDNPNSAGGQDVTPQTARDNSVLALLSQASDQPAATLRPDVRSALGLRNSISANLFSESESLQSRWESLIKIIPRQSEILQYAIMFLLVLVEY